MSRLQPNPNTSTISNEPIKNIDIQQILFDNIKWQFAHEATNIGIWDFNAELDEIHFSEDSKRIIGVEHIETFGKNSQDWNNRVHPDDKPKYFQDFQDHLNGKVPLYINEHRVRCEDGSYKWILDRGKIIERYSDGSAKRIIGTHVDITKYKEHEFSLSKSLDIITNQNLKLKNFAHIVTHNLKSHSANFENLMQFYDETNCEKEKQELITHLKTVSESLTNTIKHLSDIVSVQTRDVSIEKLYISEYINKVCHIFDLEIEHNNVTIDNNIDPRLYIYYNPAYLESIIQNLLSNAIKYKHPDRDPKIELNCKLMSKQLIISVSDNGIGIDLKKYGKDLFGLYRTFHHNKDAEGVGLYLIKNQIEQYGGQIAVESKVNQGTTFIITMPNNKKRPA